MENGNGIIDIFVYSHLLSARLLVLLFVCEPPLLVFDFLEIPFKGESGLFQAVMVVPQV